MMDLIISKTTFITIYQITHIFKIIFTIELLMLYKYLEYVNIEQNIRLNIHNLKQEPLCRDMKTGLLIEYV